MIQKNERKHDAGDLSGSQWAIIAPLFHRQEIKKQMGEAGIGRRGIVLGR